MKRTGGGGRDTRGEEIGGGSVCGWGAVLRGVEADKRIELRRERRRRETGEGDGPPAHTRYLGTCI